MSTRAEIDDKMKFDACFQESWICARAVHVSEERTNYELDTVIWIPKYFDEDYPTRTLSDVISNALSLHLSLRPMKKMMTMT